LKIIDVVNLALPSLSNLAPHVSSPGDESYCLDIAMRVKLKEISKPLENASDLMISG
jgi:hypothetical protein